MESERERDRECERKRKKRSIVSHPIARAFHALRIASIKKNGISIGIAILEGRGFLFMCMQVLDKAFS